MKIQALLLRIISICSISVAVDVTDAHEDRSLERARETNMIGISIHLYMTIRQKRLAQMKSIIAKRSNSMVPPITKTTEVSFQCFVDTITIYDFYLDSLSYNKINLDCKDGNSCDFTNISLPGCIEAGGRIDRVQLNICAPWNLELNQYYDTFEEDLTITNYPYCVAPSCSSSVSYRDIFLDYSAPLERTLMGSYQTRMTSDEYKMQMGFGKCEESSSSPSAKAPNNFSSTTMVLRELAVTSSGPIVQNSWITLFISITFVACLCL